MVVFKIITINRKKILMSNKMEIRFMSGNLFLIFRGSVNNGVRTQRLQNVRSR